MIRLPVHIDNIRNGAMPQPMNSATTSTWTELQEDYELRNAVGFSEGQDTGETVASNATSNKTANNNVPSLPAPTRLRKILLVLGLVLATLDLCILPITYFYSLTYATSLTRQHGQTHYFVH